MAKMNDNFTSDAVYEDLFASCKNRDEIGESLIYILSCHRRDLDMLRRDS
jgi:hypothetical protein